MVFKTVTLEEVTKENEKIETPKGHRIELLEVQYLEVLNRRGKSKIRLREATKIGQKKRKGRENICLVSCLFVYLLSFYIYIHADI